MKAEFLKALKQIIRDQVVQDNSVEFGDLGRFELHHETQRQVKNEKGKIVMIPPENRVVFKANAQSSEHED
ncbi:MAG: HU family DNA-binding protein [Balneolaceae bacterium]